MPRGVHNPDAPSWPTLKRMVIARDGRRCRHCGIMTHGGADCPRGRKGCHECTHVDHFPLRKIDGGPDHPSNLVVACRRCNLRQRGMGDPRQPAQHQHATRPPAATTPPAIPPPPGGWRMTGVGRR